jgi:hypothetical protein
MDDANECPMMLLEVEIARHSGTTYEAVGKGLFQAGALRSVTLVSRYSATREQVERLQSECAGFFDVDVNERDEDFDVLKRRLFDAQEAVRLSADASAMATGRLLISRVLTAFDILEEMQHAPKQLRRELGRDIFLTLRRELADFLRPPMTLAPPGREL